MIDGRNDGGRRRQLGVWNRNDYRNEQRRSRMYGEAIKTYIRRPKADLEKVLCNSISKSNLPNSQIISESDSSLLFGRVTNSTQ